MDKILAVVKGKNLTENDLELQLSKFPPERREYYKSEEGKKQFVEQMVAWELFYNYSKDNGFEEMEEYKREIEIAKKALLTQLAITDLISKIDVSSSEVEAYYKENEEAFVEKDKVKAKHILVENEEKAKEVLDVIKNGMTFEEAASLYSSCPSKNKGGDLGYFERGTMVPEFENAAFNLGKGEMSGPVKSPFGYHIILVEDKKDKSLKALSEVKDEIERFLKGNKQNQEYFKFVEELKGKYPVEIK